MKKMLNFLIETIHGNFAPYCVYNAHFKKEHYCYSWNSALEWMACYDAEEFGETFVHGWNGEIISMKYIVSRKIS